MTQAAKRPYTGTRRTGGSQPTHNGHGPLGEQDLVGDRDRDDGNKRDDRTERDERAQRNSGDEQSEQRARREQDERREYRADDREDRADDRDVRNERLERDSRDEQSDQRRRGEQRHGDRGELGDGREPRREPDGVQRTLEQVTDRARAATSNPGDAFAGTPDMSKVLTAWFDMAGDMMKLQQQFFANILGAGNANDRNTTKV
jgi:hypothetical protein